MRVVLLAMGLLLLGVSGCRQQRPVTATSDSRCKADPKDKGRPMVVEWPAADRAALEAEAAHSVVVVSYRDCELRVLSQCSVPGGYELTRTTPARDYVDIRSEDELFASLPFGAAKFSAEVRAGQALRLDYFVIGQRRANTTAVDAEQLGPDCKEATHFVRAMMIGASTLSTGAHHAAGARTGVLGAQGGGHTSGSSRRLASNGKMQECDESTPGLSCHALVQLDLAPLRASNPGSAVIAPAMAGDVHEGTLGSGSQRMSSGEFANSYTVESDGKQPLRIAMDSSEFDAYLVVRTPDGQQFDNDDAPGRDSNALVELPRALAGSYRVIATTYQSGQGGRYRLTLQNGRIAPTASTPEPSAKPPTANFGTIRLSNGFSPDPQLASGKAGGKLDAKTKHADCTGWIDERPDHILELGASFPFLRIFATSSADTSLVVEGPGGAVRCNDDEFGIHPSIEGPAQAGTYRIWIGNLKPGQVADYQLTFTERLGSSPFQVVDSRATFGATVVQPGFRPDPMVLTGKAGGEQEASRRKAGCAGFVGEKPDHVLQLTGGFKFLRMIGKSTADTSLVIETPSGTILCDDDTFGHHPSIDGAMTAGVYKVWVGTMSKGEALPYKLLLSELEASRP